MATVAIAVVRANGNRWTSVKRATEMGDETLSTAYKVWHMLTTDPVGVKALIRKTDMQAAKKALEDLGDRSNLSASDLRLRTLLIDLGRAGGVPERELRRVAMVGAYYVNGLKRNYPRKDLWASMKGGEHVGTPGSSVSVGDYATVTHMIPISPLQMGGTLRERTLYKVMTDSGLCCQWMEVERSHLNFRRLKEGERILLRSGKVKVHTTCDGVNWTEFHPNAVDILANQPVSK